MALTGSTDASPRSDSSPIQDASASGPPRRTSEAMESATASSCSSLTGRLLAARPSPRNSFWRSKRSRPPSRFSTVTGASSGRS
jgi:hypothetical protein